MSKVKLVKNRLRSTMTDDYFSSLLIVAMENDIADKISNERVVQRFAALSPVLAKHLLCYSQRTVVSCYIRHSSDA